MMSPIEQAKENLSWYLQQAWEAAGLGWTADNQGEAENIVDAIAEAVRPGPTDAGPGATTTAGDTAHPPAGDLT